VKQSIPDSKQKTQQRKVVWEKIVNEDEQRYNEQMAREMDCVTNMITKAKQQGLLTEVVMWYGDYRAAGDSIETACFAALCDWDC
jgi:DNA anti-recombination protein RmuC